MAVINVWGKKPVYMRMISSDFDARTQIKKIIETKDLTGIYNLVQDETISKYSLLKLIAKVFNRDIKVKKNDSVKSNKTLINNRKDEYFPDIPSYLHQLQELKRFYYS